MPLPAWLLHAPPRDGSSSGGSGGAPQGTSSSSSGACSPESPPRPAGAAGWRGRPSSRRPPRRAGSCGPAGAAVADQAASPRPPRFRLQFSKVDEWLERRGYNLRGRQGGAELTHSRIDAGRLTRVYGGKFAVPDEELDEFRRRVARSGDAPYYFHEVTTSVFPLFVDIDGAAGGAAAVSRCIAAGVQSCYGPSADTRAIVLGCEGSADKPGGLHIHFPGLFVDERIAWRVRHAAISHIANCLKVTAAGQGSPQRGGPAAESAADCAASWDLAWDAPARSGCGSASTLYPAGLRLVGSRKCARCGECGAQGCHNCISGFVDRGRVYRLLLCYKSGSTEADEEERRLLQSDRFLLLKRTTVRSPEAAEPAPAPLAHVLKVALPRMRQRAKLRNASRGRAPAQSSAALQCSARAGQHNYSPPAAGGERGESAAQGAGRQRGGSRGPRGRAGYGAAPGPWAAAAAAQAPRAGSRGPGQRAAGGVMAP